MENREKEITTIKEIKEKYDEIFANTPPGQEDSVRTPSSKVRKALNERYGDLQIPESADDVAERLPIGSRPHPTVKGLIEKEGE